MADKIVQVENLTKFFGKTQALRDVTFDLRAGEVMGFIGPNGAGKSTTIRILLGMLQKDAGSAQIFCLDVWRDSVEIHRRISYVPGDVVLWGNLSGGETIDLFMKLHGAGDRGKRDALIERFELDPTKKAKTYSKGNRQKVGLISALAVDSDLYIFDEPTSGLDPLMELAFQDEVRILKEAGKAVLLSSHILSEVERLADRVVIIRQGQLVESGDLTQMRHLTSSRILLATESDVNSMQAIKGVYDFVLDDGQAVFSVNHDDLNEVLAQATRLGVIKLEVAPPTLEDLFIRHYQA